MIQLLHWLKFFQRFTHLLGALHVHVEKEELCGKTRKYCKITTSLFSAPAFPANLLFMLQLTQRSGYQTKVLGTLLQHIDNLCLNVLESSFKPQLGVSQCQYSAFLVYVPVNLPQSARQQIISTWYRVQCNVECNGIICYSIGSQRQGGICQQLNKLHKCIKKWLVATTDPFLIYFFYTRDPPLNSRIMQSHFRFYRLESEFQIDGICCWAKAESQKCCKLGIACWRFHCQSCCTANSSHSWAATTNNWYFQWEDIFQWQWSIYSNLNVANKSLSI